MFERTFRKYTVQGLIYLRGAYGIGIDRPGNINTTRARQTRDFPQSSHPAVVVGRMIVEEM